MGSSFYLLVTVATIFCLIHISNASNIKFNTSSPTFLPRLTSNMTMRCGLDGTTSPGSSIIGRDLTQTTSDVQFITAIMISRNNGDDVATINEHFPAKGIADISNIQVKGDVSGTSGDQGYLEVTWTHPTTAQVGEYLCEISAISSSGHSVLLSSTLEVNVSEPSINDLVDFVSSLQETVTQQKALIQTQSAQINQLLTESWKNDTHILDIVSKAGHIEIGTVDSSGMTSSSTTKTVTQTFAKPYDVPPKVHVALSSFDIHEVIHGSEAYVQIYILDLAVTTQGFTVKFKSDSLHVYEGKFTWISVPN